jgi:regulator of sirC expression with transglutaminase-like and TPR domain
MPGSLHFEAPTALQYFATLVAEDASLSLLEAAIAVAQDEYPRLDVQAVLAQVDELADKLRAHPGRRGAAAAAAAAEPLLLPRAGLRRQRERLLRPRNSYLPDVLRTRRGIPITLALLYMSSWPARWACRRGRLVPGHFLVKLHMPQGEVVIDPFSGQSLSREDLDERLLPYRRQRGLTGDFEAPLGLFLQAAPPRDVWRGCCAT